ncbi:MAG: radical SAM protein [Deltaproteobacteria bacterium]|nr:radical SAM protein [Deltaproteobacteria bacterium]
MGSPDIRIRSEQFGYTIAFKSGTVGFYQHSAGALLLDGASEEELEEHKIKTMAVGENFHLSGPLIAWLELTLKCNLPCKHCYINAGSKRPNELDTEELKGVIDQLADKGVMCLVLIGGEPMMHPDFLELLHHAYDRDLVICVATNGHYIEPEILEQIPKDVVISISADGTSYQKKLRVTSSWDRIRSKLLMVRKAGFPTGIMATLTNQNVDECHELLDFAIENDIYFGTSTFEPIGRGQRFPELKPTAAIAEQAAELRRREEEHEGNILPRLGLTFTKFFYASHVIGAATKQEFCGSTLAYIQADGEVFPCTSCSSIQRHSAGSLRTQKFDEIWETGFTEFRKMTWDKFKGCASCEYSKKEYTCFGRCPVLSEVYTGDPLVCGFSDFQREQLRLRSKPAPVV